MSNKFQVQWEDEDTGFEDEFSQPSDGPSGEAGRGEFEKMLAGDEAVDHEPLRVGDQVEGVISYTGSGSDDIMLELGSKVTGVIARQDLSDEEGNLRYSAGDTVTAFVVSVTDGEVILSNSMNHNVAKKQALESAHESGMPVKGKVTAVKKGGFEITLMGRKAFCPVSQIALTFVENPADFVGKELEFKIQSLSARDCVVSRSALLKKQAEKTMEVLRECLAQELPVEGEIVELREFGAMTDLGGVLGMIHISETGYGHPGHPSDYLSLGDKVRVKILSIDSSGRQPRIALSIKALQKDPWESVTEEFRTGESYQGKVVRLADFGAFVELKPGVDGLIHLSEMSWEKRVLHAKEVLSVGDFVSVRITDCNPIQKRISLSLKSPEESPWFEADKKYKPGTKLEGTVQQLRSFGAIVELAAGVTGLVPVAILREAFGDSFKKKASPPATLAVKVLEVNTEDQKILLSLPSLDDKGAEEKAFADYQQKQQNTKQSVAGKSQGSFGDLLQKSLQRKST